MACMHHASVCRLHGSTALFFPFIAWLVLAGCVARVWLNSRQHVCSALLTATGARLVAGFLLSAWCMLVLSPRETCAEMV
jgi:hypothetical protein